MVGQCSFSGLAVLETYGYKTGKTGEWVGFLLAIVFGLRFLGWAALWARK
jgi:ATP-binding cassette, subfamily G (WHITE), member 2